MSLGDVECIDCSSFSLLLCSTPVLSMISRRLFCDGSKFGCTGITINVYKDSGESVAFIAAVSPLVSDSTINSFVVSLSEVSELMTVVVDAAGADDDEP